MEALRIVIGQATLSSAAGSASFIFMTIPRLTVILPNCAVEVVEIR
jgi:hypothetical protein